MTNLAKQGPCNRNCAAMFGENSVICLTPREYVPWFEICHNNRLLCDAKNTQYVPGVVGLVTSNWVRYMSVLSMMELLLQVVLHLILINVEFAKYIINLSKQYVTTQITVNSNK